MAKPNRPFAVDVRDRPFWKQFHDRGVHARDRPIINGDTNQTADHAFSARPQIVQRIPCESYRPQIVSPVLVSSGQVLLEDQGFALDDEDRMNVLGRRVAQSST